MQKAIPIAMQMTEIEIATSKTRGLSMGVPHRLRQRRVGHLVRWTLVAVLGLSLSSAGAAEVVNGVLLRINDQIVTQYDYDSQLADRRGAIRMAEMPDETRQGLIDDSGTQVFREVYEDLLLRSRATQLGLFATEGEIAAAVESSKERMGIASDAEMAQALAASGMTLDQLRDKMKATILVQQVVNREIRSKITVDEDELRKVYREHEEELTIPASRLVEEIVVLEEVTPELEARHAVIADLHAAIEGGAEFADAAAVLAESGVTSAVIDLGWVEPGHLASDIGDVVWQLEVGQFSDPVESRGGTHVLRVLEVREETVRPFDEVRDQLLARERERRMSDAYRSYLLDLEETAFVEMQVPPEAAGFRGLMSSLDAE